MCGDWHEAEDLSQEVFFEVYRRWDALRDRDRLAPYVRQILKTKYLTGRRRVWRTRESIQESLPESPTQQIDFEKNIALSLAIEALTADQRAVIVLRFWNELSIVEISKRFGDSRKAVSSRIREALDALHSGVR